MASAPVGRHGRHDELEILLRVAEGLLPIEHLVPVGHGHVVRHGDVLEPELGAIEPLLVRAVLGQRVLELAVVDDAPLDEIDEQHLPRLEAPLLDDLALRDVEHARLRGEDHVVVVGDHVARGAQAVAVERGADLPPVGEGHGGGAVPGLHQRGVVLVEGAALVVHEGVVGPGLGDHQHHRVGQRVAAEVEQLQRVVEGGGVGLAVVDERPDLVEPLPEELGGDVLLARAQPVDVAAQGVDLAVVGDEAEGVRQVPRGEGVGGEALVDHGDGRLERRVLQVEVELADLVGQQHPLVDQRPRRERGHVELAPAAQAERADGVPRALADDVELALEGVDVGRGEAAPDEHLADDRLAGLDALAQAAIVDGHVAPAEQLLPLGRDGAGDLVLARGAGPGIAREEDHPHAVLADVGQLDADLGALPAEERVRDLDEDARAVALQRIRAGRPAVGEVGEDAQALRDDLVALLVLDVGDEAEPAGVVLVAWIVEALAWWRRGVVHEALSTVVPGGAQRSRRAAAASRRTCLTACLEKDSVAAREARMAARHTAGGSG